MKKGLWNKPDKLIRAPHGKPNKLSAHRNHTRWSDHKLLIGQVVADSPRPVTSLAKVTLYLVSPFHCFYASG